MMPSAVPAKKDHGRFWAIFLEALFDSSVLVPVFYADHPHHDASARAFLAAGKEDFCALRTLGEVYATLTGLPLRPRITGPEGMAVLKQIRDRLTVISLTEQEYVSALESVSGNVSCASTGILQASKKRRHKPSWSRKRYCRRIGFPRRARFHVPLADLGEVFLKDLDGLGVRINRGQNGEARAFHAQGESAAAAEQVNAGESLH